MLVGTLKRLLHLGNSSERRFHAYCIGPAKTGTTSIARLFARHFRAAHEPEYPTMIAIAELLHAHPGDEPVDWAIRELLLERDRRLDLEMESSALTNPLCGLLAELFPEARFILTVRDPYTRTDSLFNHILSEPSTPGAWLRIRSRSYGREAPTYAPEEAPLEAAGLRPLDHYLAAYMRGIHRALDTLPSARLLVVRTDRLDAARQEIARFLGADARRLAGPEIHAFKARAKHGVLGSLDPGFVDRKVAEHCSRLLDDYFPEIGSIEDVRAAL